MYVCHSLPACYKSWHRSKKQACVGGVPHTSTQREAHTHMHPGPLNTTHQLPPPLPHAETACLSVCLPVCLVVAECCTQQREVQTAPHCMRLCRYATARTTTPVSRACTQCKNQCLDLSLFALPCCTSSISRSISSMVGVAAGCCCSRVPACSTCLYLVCLRTPVQTHPPMSWVSSCCWTTGQTGHWQQQCPSAQAKQQQREERKGREMTGQDMAS